MQASKEEILYYFEYNRERGVLIWKNHWDATARTRFTGRVAGTLKKEGYLEVKINWKLYKVHRLIWQLEHGFEAEQIDHIDGNKSNNKISNLRNVTNRQNCQNYTIHRKGKLVGCTWDKTRNRWKAQVKLNGKTKFLGRFDTEEQANLCYLSKLKELNIESL